MWILMRGMQGLRNRKTQKRKLDNKWKQSSIMKEKNNFDFYFLYCLYIKRTEFLYLKSQKKLINNYMYVIKNIHFL